MEVSINGRSGESSKRKKSLCFKSLRRHSQRFRDPTSKYRRKDWGTAIGSRHSQSVRRCAWSKSRPPIHKITCLAAIRSEAAQARNGSKSPRAREQTKSRGATSSPSSSYRLTSTRVSGSSMFQSTSAKNVAFFMFDSTRNMFRFGRMILSGMPGKPAPEPTSASRPFSTGTATAAYILSQK